MVVVTLGTAPVPVKMPCPPAFKFAKNATVPPALIEGPLNLLNGPLVSAMVVVTFGTAPVPVKMPWPPASNNDRNATVPPALIEGEAKKMKLNGPLLSAISVKL